MSKKQRLPWSPHSRSLFDIRLPAGASVALESLWMLRLLLDGQGLESIARRHNRFETSTLLALGIEPIPESEDDGGVPIDDRLATTLRTRRAELETTDPERNGALIENIAHLGERLGLNETEQRLLAFLSVEGMNRGLSWLMQDCLQVLQRDNHAMLAIALARPEDEVRRALAPNATLLRSGLVEPRPGYTPGDKESGFDLLAGLAADLMSCPQSPERVLRSYFRPTPGPALQPDRMPHLQAELEALTALLGRTAREGITGVNILLFGPPGTGKTELARLCIQLAGVRGHEVNHEDQYGNPMPPQNRQRAYQLCQHLLERDRGAAVVFDEIEDIYSDRHAGALFNLRPEQAGGKAWTNRMLETNPVPAIWITNHVRTLDPAYLRRFDYTLELRHPPQSVRRLLLEQFCERLSVSTEWIERVAKIESLTPADIERIARVAGLLDDVLEPERIQGFLDEQLRRLLRLKGSTTPLRRRGADALPWRTEYLNAIPDIDRLLERLQRQSETSVLMHGPPGTGKTALAEQIAERTDRPLIKRPVSALMSPFVGETEQNIAQLFDEAERDGAVLLIDEADSLLSSRERARARWEVTQTNELLVQIESFPGILICATNFLETLDSAVLRRFDHKVELKSLDRDQRRNLLLELAQRLGTYLPSNTDDLSRLDGLNNLAPGDFATVARRFLPSDDESPTVQELVEALCTESHIKPCNRRNIAGFLHPPE